MFYSSDKQTIVDEKGYVWHDMLNLEEDGWEIYRQPIVANGLVELFAKHNALGKDSQKWKTSDGTMVQTYSFAGSSIVVRDPKSWLSFPLSDFYLTDTFTLVE